MDVSGYWTSVLTYGKGYRKLEGQTITCELQLQQVGKAFMGSSQDVNGEGCHPEEATITGQVTLDGEIAFTKKYPCLHSIDRKGELILYPKIDGPEIEFTGNFDQGSNRFSGNWQVSVKVYFLGLIPKNVTSKGEWVMEKVL